jgi:putative transposase
MTNLFPMESRDREVLFVKAGESRHAVAARLGVRASSVIKWLARHRQTGSVAPSKIGGYRPQKIVGANREWLPARIAAGDFTLQGLADDLEAPRFQG